MVFESLDRDRGFRFGWQNKPKTKKIKIMWFRELHQRISPNKMFRYALPSVFHPAKFSEGGTPYVTRLRLSPGNPLSHPGRETR